MMQAYRVYTHDSGDSGDYYCEEGLRYSIDSLGTGILFIAGAKQIAWYPRDRIIKIVSAEQIAVTLPTSIQ